MFFKITLYTFSKSIIKKTKAKKEIEKKVMVINQSLS